MASNMDTTGTFKMHEVLGSAGMMTCIARHYNAGNENGMLWNAVNHKNRICVMSGISNKELLEIVRMSELWKN